MGTRSQEWVPIFVLYAFVVHSFGTGDNGRQLVDPAIFAGHYQEDL